MGCGAGTAWKDKNCSCLKNSRKDFKLHAAAGGRCIECIKKAVVHNNKLGEPRSVMIGHNILGLDEPRSVPHEKGSAEFRNVEATTPLMLAVCWGDNDVIMALLKLGADVTVEVPVTSDISDLRAAKVLECGDDRDPGLANAVDYMVAFNHYNATTIPSMNMLLHDVPLLPETVKAMYDAWDQKVADNAFLNMVRDRTAQYEEHKREQFQSERDKARDRGERDRDVS